MTTRLHDLAAQLGPDELRVLERIAERLVMGRKAYGELRLATDRRDWREEAQQEALDLAVYLAIGLEAPGATSREREGYGVAVRLRQAGARRGARDLDDGGER